MPAAVQRNAISAFRHRPRCDRRGARSPSCSQLVGAGERAPELCRQAEAVDGQHLVEPFEDASGDKLGAFYRRLSSRIGKAKAVTPTARKVAVLFYNAVRHGMEYVDPGASSYETRTFGGAARSKFLYLSANE